MKALSIRPPWGSLICQGMPLIQMVDNGDGSQRVELSGKVSMKNIENRSWATKFRGRIFVHQGKRLASDDDMIALFKIGFSPMSVMVLFGNSERTRQAIPRGAIIGEVDIVDCVEESGSPWFVGPYGFVLENAVLYDEPIPCTGHLGFFTPALTTV